MCLTLSAHVHIHAIRVFTTAVEGHCLATFINRPKINSKIFVKFNEGLCLPIYFKSANELTIGASCELVLCQSTSS